MKKANFFWVSYADLMTSLFFVMLVLYIVTFSILKKEMFGAKQAEQKLKDIESIEKALETLDKNYFEFDDLNKRYKLKTDVSFHGGSDNIHDIPTPKRAELYQAGKSLYQKISTIIEENPNVDYLLVIEGNTQRANNNWNRIPDVGYQLSYRRALSLFNFWKKRGIDFRDLGSHCEIILAGSGYFGYSRDKLHEYKNRRFTIQITSKVGKLI